MGRLRTRAGFTLVETMVTGGLLLSTSLIITLWMNGASELWWVTATQSDVRMKAQQGVQRISDELRSGTRTAPASPPNAVIPAAPNNTQVTFYLPADLDANGTVVDAIGQTEWGVLSPIVYAYDANTRRILRTQNGTTTQIVQDVQAATFEDRTINNTLNTDEIRITITVQRLTPQRRSLQSTTVETVQLRN